ncbi:phage minor capsid protein [Streptococcus equi]|uniref:phage minor capsid protein n=1 Tax=Streptococcus equi TaxID=1336 RepID=UPI0039C5D5F8
MQLSFDLIELYSDVERELLTSIGRRFAKHYDEMVAGDIMDWQIRQLLEVGELRKEHHRNHAKKCTRES